MDKTCPSKVGRIQISSSWSETWINRYHNKKKSKYQCYKTNKNNNMQSTIRCNVEMLFCNSSWKEGGETDEIQWLWDHCPPWTPGCVISLAFFFFFNCLKKKNESKAKQDKIMQHSPDTYHIMPRKWAMNSDQLKIIPFSRTVQCGEI